MRFADLLHLATQSVLRSRLRSVMLLLAMAIGVASVVMLTSLGDGARRYVTGEFQTLGTRTIIVLPGRTETGGIQPGILSGETPRPLTLADASSLLKIPEVERVAPLILGSTTVTSGNLSRDSPVVGTNADWMHVMNLVVARGDFLPAGELDRDLAVCVMGDHVARELFPNTEALGRTVRIGERRFRIVGILESQGRSIGMDSQELVVIPVSSAQALFNTEALFRLMIQTRNREDVPRVRKEVIETLKDRHQGEEDVTVVTQDALLSTFDRIFLALTMTLAGIASISLIVAGVLVMNVMLVSVSQRTAEIGLLKAIGAHGRQITALFLAEAIILSTIGAIVGLGVGLSADWLVHSIYPRLPLSPPIWAVVMGIGTAVASGVIFGLLPARRAARLDPVESLAGKK
jgi:putative ABC transport system permease protein